MAKRAWSWRIAASVILPSVLALGAANLDGQAHLSQMYHRAWTARDGAPNNIEKIVQGPDGFLWLTTEDGLFRFDGVTFSRYQPTNGSVLLSDRMQDIIVARDGSIWLSYTLGGVTRIKGNAVTSFSGREGLKGSQFPTLAEGADGTIWITGTRGIEFIRNSQVHRFEDNSGVADLPNESIVVDHSGNVWINPESRLLVLPHGGKNFMPASNDAYFGCDSALDQGVLCRSVKAPLTHFVFTGSRIASRVLVRPPSNYWKVLAQKDGSLWIATDRNGIERVPSVVDSDSPPRAPELFGHRDGLTSDRVITLVDDREGSVWVVTDRGLDQFRPVPFHALDLDAPTVTLPSNKIGNPFLIATDRLAELRQNTLHYLSPAWPVGGAAGSMYRADDGSVWLGTTTGLFRYAEGHLQRIQCPIGQPKFGRTQTIVEDSNGHMWVSGSRGGLYRIDGQQWIDRGGLPGMPKGTAYVALRDQTGALWFGFRNSVLARVSSEKVTIFDKSSDLNLGDIRTLSERDGRIWVGGDRGLVTFDHGRFLPLVLRGPHMLKGVSGVVFTPDGDLWINSSSGVFQITKDELSKWDMDRGHVVAWRSFNYLDGIDGIPSPSSGNPSAALGPDGRLYLATNRRVQWIDLQKLPDNPVPPQVWITNIHTESRDILPESPSVRLKSDLRNLEISYTATSLLIPERVRFRYRLHGYENEWVEAGSRRQAFYANLPPGRYTFEVNACNDSGVWSRTAASVALTVPPTFVQTIWFKLGLLFGLMSVLFLGFRIRLNSTKRRIANQMYDIMSERQRIARDLHDTLLQSVQAIMFKVGVVAAKLPMDNSVRTVLEETMTQSDRVLMDGRRLISNLQTREESTDALLESLRTMVEDLKAASPSTHFILDIQGKERLLNTVVQQELCNIGREALSNASRHANASHVWLMLRTAPEELRLEVRDDGQGIDSEVLKRGYRPGHWGLRNMPDRTKRLGGRFTLRSSPGGGTLIEVAVPAFVAYKDAPRSLREKLWRWLG